MTAHDWNALVRERLASLAVDPARQLDVVDELAGHVAEQYAELVAAGVDEARAVAEALAPLDERARAAAATAPRALPLAGESPRRERLAMLGYHMRHACRMLLRERGFAASAVLTLALGVGANVAMFAVVDAVLLRPLPYSNANALVVLKHRDERTGITKEFIAIGDYVDIAARQQSFSALGAYGTQRATVFDMGDPFEVSALLATSGVFDALGVEPVSGRVLNPGDSRPGAAHVAVIGYQFWQQRFGGDRRAIGRGIRIDGDNCQIVGIAPPGFRFPPNAAADVILPSAIPLAAPASRQSDWRFAVARLKPGVSLEAAAANLTAISTQLADAYPSQNRASEYLAVPLRDALVGSSQTALWLLFGAVGVLLVVACVNVANLMLARALSRRREIATRRALGASPGHLAAQFIAESLALALAAAAAGILMAQWGTRTLLSLVPRSLVVTGLAEVQINRAVLAFTVALSIATALSFGLLSMLTTRSDTGSTAFTTGRATLGRSTRRAASALVIGEVALALVLLVGAGLILRTFARLASVDPGFRGDHVVTLTTQLPADRYRDSAGRQAFYRRAFESLRALPEVQAVGVAAVIPLTGNNWSVPFERADQPVGGGQRPPDVGWQTASAGYFAAMHIPLLAGRLFDDRDRPDGPRVVVVSRTLERRFFAGESAVGRRANVDGVIAEIIGVVGDIRRASLANEPRPDLYYSSEQVPMTTTTWFVRTGADPARLASILLTHLHAIEPQILGLDSRRMADVERESTQVTRLVLWLIGLFAVTALALAAVGVYGVMSYVIRQRTREIGLRVALGATRAAIVQLVMRQGLAIAVGGTVLGVAIALAAARTLEGLLYGIAPRDVTTLAVASATLIGTTLCACYIPARRAARIDPARTLTES
jgi:putative ABC transport system permease protein